MKIFLQILMGIAFVVGIVALIYNEFISSALFVGLGFVLDSFFSGLKSIATDLKNLALNHFS